MIRGGIRLGILYFVVWVICVHWDGGADFYRQSVEWLRSFLPFSSKLNLFLAFLGIAGGWHLAGFWFWIYTITLSHRKGPVRHPLPVQPLRYYFRIRVRRTTGAIISSLVALLFALQALQNIRIRSFDTEPFSFIYNLPFFPDLGGRATPWVAYGIVHLTAVVIGWALLGLMAVKRLSPSEDGHNAFMHYQAKRNPVAKVFTIVVMLTHFPFAGITAFTHTHPFHGLVVVCSLTAILLAALWGQAISLGIARSQDRWLSFIIEKARRKGPKAKEYRAWESTMVFLRDEKPLSLEGEVDIGASWRDADEETKVSSPVHSRKKTDIKTEPEQTSQARPRESKRRFSVAKLTGSLALTALAVGIVLSLGLAFQWSTLPGADETRQLARSAHVHVKKHNVNGQSMLTLFGNRYDYSLNISLKNISKNFHHAVIASEDHRFYNHGAPYIAPLPRHLNLLSTLLHLNPALSRLLLSMPVRSQFPCQENPNPINRKITTGKPMARSVYVQALFIQLIRPRSICYTIMWVLKGC